MLYAIIFIVAAIVAVYAVTLWILKESHEAKGVIGECLKRWSGGLTPQALLDDTESACAEARIAPDLVVVCHDITPVYDALRRSVLQEAPATPLANGLVLALAVGVDAGRLYLRVVEAPQANRIGADRRIFCDFDDIQAIETTSPNLPAELAPPGREALAIRLTGAPSCAYALVIEPAWGVGARELADRLRAMVHQRERPPAVPVVVR
jgi:hypothetical protein